MTQPDRWTLSIDDGTWRIGRLTTDGAQWTVLEEPASSESADWAAVAAASMRSLGYEGSGIVLAIPSAWSLACRIAIDSPAQLRDRKALVFELESQVPLAAEEMVADYVGHKHFALAVAAPIERLVSVVDALEEHGVSIQSIIPRGLLAVAQLSQSVDVTGETVLLMGDGQRLEVFVFEQNRLASWLVLPHDAQSVLRILQLLTFDAPTCRTVKALNLSTDVHEGLSASVGDGWQNLDSFGVDELLLREADAILSGKRHAWIDLRCDHLASSDSWKPLRSQVRRAMVAITVLLATFSSACLWHAHQLYDEARRNDDLQASVFREVFPGQAVPVGVRLRLEGERQKLGAMATATTESPPDRSALIVLRGLLAALPKDFRCRTHELRVDRERLSFDAEVRTHGDAEIIAAGLRGQGFEVEPPRTEQLANAVVGVRIQARVATRGSTNP